MIKLTMIFRKALLIFSIIGYSFAYLMTSLKIKYYSSFPCINMHINAVITPLTIHPNGIAIKNLQSLKPKPKAIMTPIIVKTTLIDEINSDKLCRKIVIRLFFSFLNTH
ncbi:unnamed protein product [Commensalibacter communis]|nr:unnamed protein product [Commensalibacter communis]CAI3956148.1 unnamed protein product [Commensalibacter communis]